MTQSKDINLIALQRVDPCAELIITQATQVALYRFRPEKNNWEKAETEGCMFVYRRTALPRYSFIIKNRQNPNDFIEPLADNLEFQIQKPYLFYRKLGAITGLWFYEDSECDEIAKLLNTLVKDQYGKLTFSSSSPRRPIKKSQDVNSIDFDSKPDVLNLLSKAKSEYTKDKSPSPHSASREQKVVRIQQRPERVEKNVSGVEALLASASGPSMDKLSLAEKTDTDSGQPTPPMPDVLQRLFSVPQAIDDSRKVERKTTLNASDLEREIFAEQGASRKLSNPEVDQSLEVEFGDDRFNLTDDPVFVDDDIPLIDDSDLMYNVNPPDLLITPQELTGLTPNPILANHSRGSSYVSGVLTRNVSMIPMIGSERESPCLSETADTTLPESRPQVAPLTKDQMQQAFQYLLNKDSGFVAQLHEAYVKSLNESLGV